MSAYYRVAVPSEKTVYFLGTITNAIRTLPLLIEERLENKTFVVYEDGGFMEDKYEYDLDYRKSDFDLYPARMHDWVEDNKLSRDDFQKKFDDYYGKEKTKSDWIIT